ncbi:MAG: hypothetical protein NTU53_06260 [Planctomycetota bacterium]|nr:hypothetical protein [Planctomycetota bacterium]
MTTTTTTTAAAREAQLCFQANRSALAQTQPDLDPPKPSTRLEYVYARDGSVTAIDPTGHFLADCSLPRRAAAELLRKMTPPVGTSCFLAPTHAAQIQVALDTADPRAIVVILPDALALDPILHCHDFSTPIVAHRLWFVVAPDWPSQLLTLFRLHPGLPLPQNFLKTADLSDDASSTLMPTAQRIFSQLTQDRTQLRTQILCQEHTPTRTFCVLAPSRFRLWDDPGSILADLLCTERIRRIDPDDPCSAGTLALALATRDCKALVTANATRAELADGVPPHVPIFSWLTLPAIPSFSKAMPHDALLLADAAWLPLARKLGWPANRLTPAGWPTVRLPDPPSDPHLAIIADTTDLATPPTFDLSSHRLLWDTIADELGASPFLAAPDPDRYLTTRMTRLAISDDSLDRRRFIDQLIRPIYAQSLARMLIGVSIPVRLHGRGWSHLADFSRHFANEIHSRAALVSAASSATALVHISPTPWSHPIHSLCRPVLTPHQSPTTFLANAARILSNPPPYTAPPNPLCLAHFLIPDR